MTQNIWDFWADRYEKLWVQKYSLQPTRDLVIRELEKILALDKDRELKLLDVGCGTGQLVEEISTKIVSHKIKIIGIDTSFKMIEKARDKNIPHTTFVEGDALNLPFHTGEFDIVTCCHSFPYYEDKIKSLTEFNRVLKPGGYLFLIQASVNNLYDKMVMKIVKLTTSKAIYPSIKEIEVMVHQGGARLLIQKKLQTKFYIPSIVLSICQNGDLA